MPAPFNLPKKEWRDIAVALYNEIQSNVFNEITEDLSNGKIQNNTGLSDDDFVENKVIENINYQFGIPKEVQRLIMKGEI